MVLGLKSNICMSATSNSLFFRHSAAILKRLQRESISRRFSVSDIVSRDLSFAVAISGLMPNSGCISLQAMQGTASMIVIIISTTSTSNHHHNHHHHHSHTLPSEFQLLYSSMFQTYSSTSQFESIPELEAFDRENVCYSGPDALDGSAVVYVCLERLKPDHLSIAHCILARMYLLFSTVVNRPFNILVDCSGVQASSDPVIAIMKEMTAILLAAFDAAAKKRLKHLFLVHPSVDTLRSIQEFIGQTSPKLWHKVGMRAAARGFGCGHDADDYGDNEQSTLYSVVDAC